MIRKIINWLTATSDGKRLHIFLLTVYIPTTSIFFGYDKALVSAIIIAIGKELFDKFYKKTKFSIQDLIYDVKGIFYGSLLTTILFRLFPVLLDIQTEIIKLF